MNSSLIILKVDIKNSNSMTNTLKYSVFSMAGKELDLKYCDGSTVKVEYPLANTESVNITYASEMNYLGIDIFNVNDTFFNQICEPFSENGNDIIIKDRRDDIYENVSICNDGCVYQGINYTTMKAVCENHNQIHQMI